MAGRIRTIKPELLEDEKAAALPDNAWRLFVGSWLLADDHGNFRAGERYLAAHIWQDTSRLAEARGGLRRLAADNFVSIYEVNGEIYAHIRTWAQHQRVDNAGKARMPGPDKAERDLTQEFAESLGESPRFAARPRPPTTDLDQDLDLDLRSAASPRGAPDHPEPDASSAPGSNLKNGKSKKRSKSLMPDDWQPPPGVYVWARHFLDVRMVEDDVLGALEEFRDYHIQKGTLHNERGRLAAFRTWLRNQRKFQGPKLRESYDRNDDEVWGTTPQGFDWENAGRQGDLL